jgi:outer membrane protein assembly factor BamB
VSFRTVVFSSAAGLAGILLCSCWGELDLVHVTEGYPFFHKLEVFGDRFTTVAPDIKTVRGLTFDGRETWRRPLAANALVERHNDEFLYVQDDRTVFNVRGSDGVAERLFDVPEHKQFVWHPESGAMFFVDERFDKYAFQLLDPKSRQAMWTSENVRSILHGDETRLVVASMKRNYANDRLSFTETDVAIAGIDRRTGDVRWRIPLRTASSFFRIANVPACIVVLDEGAEGGLSCIDRATGQVLGRRPHSTPYGFGYTDVVAVGDQVAFLERDGDRHVLRFATVPSFMDRTRGPDPGQRLQQSDAACPPDDGGRGERQRARPSDRGRPPGHPPHALTS